MQRKPNFETEHQVKELTPRKVPSRDDKAKEAPDSSRWINQYEMPLHHLIEQDKFSNAMEVIEGKPVTKYMQNRIRLGKKISVDAKTLHFDGHPFEEPRDE